MRTFVKRGIALRTSVRNSDASSNQQKLKALYVKGRDRTLLAAGGCTTTLGCTCSTCC